MVPSALVARLPPRVCCCSCSTGNLFAANARVGAFFFFAAAAPGFLFLLIESIGRAFAFAFLLLLTLFPAGNWWNFRFLCISAPSETACGPPSRLLIKESSTFSFAVVSNRVYAFKSSPGEERNRLINSDETTSAAGYASMAFLTRPDSALSSLQTMISTASSSSSPESLMAILSS